MMKIFTYIAIFSLAIALSSCATVPVEVPPDIKWPMPPERTRINYVDYLIGSHDILPQEDDRIKTIIFGESIEQGLDKPTFPYYKNNALYVSDLTRVRVFDFGNKKFWSIGDSYFRNATGLAVLADGTVYIGDSLQRRVFIHKPGFLRPVPVTEFGMFSSIGGMDVNEELGLIYIADTKAHNIKVMDLDGDLVMVIGYRGGGDGEFNYPYDVKVGPGGRLYISDAGNFRIQIIGPEGNFIGRFGTIGTTYGTFARPKGLALDPDNNIYVLDSAFGNFQIFNQRGQLLLAVGQTGKDPGMHLLPSGIFINDKGRIYIAEQGNRRIQIYQYTSYADEEKLPPPPIPPIQDEED